MLATIALHFTPITLLALDYITTLWYKRDYCIMPNTSVMA